MNTADPVLDALRAALAAGRAPDPQVRRALAEHDDPAVLRQAGRLLARSPIADGALPAIRVAILATGTIGPYEHLLRACLAGGGFRPEIAPGDYGAFEVTLATAGHPGDAPPDLVATVLDESYFLPRDWDADDLDGLEKHVETRLADFQGLVTVGVAGTSATLVLHTIPLPGEIRDTFIGWRPRARMARLWHRVNAAILELADEHAQVAAVDLVGVLADTPVAARDARLHRYGDLPYTDGALLALAQQVRRVAQARYGLSRKVLAVDLDNTLWGGVVGEVGAGGVELGGLYPGNCYLELQRAIRRLRQQGVVLVLASKNDPEIVDRALAEHPDVQLRPDAFSVRAVNWSPKAGNLAQAAESLGLSVESFVFMDDSDFERGHVRGELPEVAIVSAAGDPAYLARSLLRPGWFDTMALTDTDRNRPELYRARALRSDFATGFGSSEEYLQALNIEVEIAPASDYTVQRLAQLAARTNQFNLTGIRFDEAETAAMSADRGHLVASVAVTDRFGAEGIVGAMWVARHEPVWRVLNLVLSCRVLGRGVELAAAGWLARQARRAGAAALAGRFVRSPKNAVAADFWIQAGFTANGNDNGDGDGGTFMLDLNGPVPTIPGWIALREWSDA